MVFGGFCWGLGVSVENMDKGRRQSLEGIRVIAARVNTGATEKRIAAPPTSDHGTKCAGAAPSGGGDQSSSGPVVSTLSAAA